MSLKQNSKRLNLKFFSREEIEEIWCGGLEEFKTVPYLHQKISILFCLDKCSAGIFSDVGTGKTISALYTAILQDKKRILIICPNSVKYNWLKEIKKHTKRKGEVLAGTTKEKQEQIQKKRWATVTNYESLRWIFLNGSKIIEKKNIMKYGNFDMIIFDEIHKLKNWKAIQSKISLELSKQVKSVIGLTGTPIGNNLLDLFNEMRVIDLGRTFGNSFWKYRKEYFDEKFGWFANEWEIKEGGEERIVEKIKNTVIRYEKSECLDLPERIYETRMIKMTDEQRKYINRFEADLDSYLKGKKVVVNGAMSKAMKISQVTGGFVKAEGKEVYFDKNPKLEELLDLIDEISGKVVIMHRFVGEGRLIEEALKKKGYKVSCLRGEVKDKQEQLLAFQNDEDVKAMVANPVSGGIGIDLYQASVMIFYSNGYSFIERYQAEGRTHRTGQVNKCLYVDLLAENTLDEIVYETLMDKKSLSDRILTKVRG